MIRSVLIYLFAASVALAQGLVPFGREELPQDGPSSTPVVLPINTDNDQWEQQYPPGVWHTLTIPGIPDNTTAIQLETILAISMGNWLGTHIGLGVYLSCADLMVTFKTPGAPDPNRWTWQVCATSIRFPCPWAPNNEIRFATCPRVNASTPLRVINRQIQFKWIKRVDYFNWPAGAPNWPDFPSMGAGTSWSKIGRAQ